ncbi:hypothetical protein E3J84_05905 [Candidatus Aerophobetes bacterium]|uniref:Transketolase-like pyrimidine-binding domain-containing protein n=1 Tax=Aerophobetes bacterium TaxID=2030807 RepID=A0A523RSD7_UNCAE|nr:MAG: hypothetical protein E3J84_05905 [Candidatus Aerophobetes bacterium]
MRIAFCEAVYEAAKQDPRVFSMSADVTGRQLTSFRNEFPERFFETGVAEQNLVGVAAGLALSGKIPFISTVASFISTRCYEQIKIDVCFQNLSVKVVGFCSAFSLSEWGATHHSLEDIAIMRALPNMTVIVTAARMEPKKAVLATAQHEGPTYIRIGKGGEPDVYQKEYDFQIGKAVVLKEGDDIALVGTGMILPELLKASDELRSQGIKARVVNMHTVKPLDKDVILKAAGETQGIITVEEHNVIGGLGDAVNQLLTRRKVNVPLEIMGIEDVFMEVGTVQELRHAHYLDSQAILNKAKEILKAE